MNQKKYQPVQSAIVVFSAALYFFYVFIQMNMFNTLNAHLIAEFRVSALKLGTLSAFYFYATVPLLLPAGILLDRFSTRKIILFSMMLLTAAVFLFSIAHHFWLAAACRFATGVGGTFALLSCIRLATRWYPPERMALIIGLIVTLAMLGGIVAQTPLALLIEKMNWRNAVWWIGILGLVITTVIAIFVRDFPPYYKQANERHHLNTLGFWRSLKLALTNPQNWLGGLYTSFLNLPIFLLGGLWGSLYLIQAHQFSTIQASYVCSMIFVGMLVGSPILGWLSDHLRLRRQPMIICALLSLFVILLLMFTVHLSLFFALLLFFLLGFFNSAQIISYPLIAESNPPAIMGTAQGIASFLIMAGGITQPLFGWLMGLSGDVVFLHNRPVYSMMDYHIAMSIMPIAFILGLLAAMLLRETHCGCNGDKLNKEILYNRVTR